MSTKIHFVNRNGQIYHSISGFPSYETALKYMMERLDTTDGGIPNGISIKAKIDQDELNNFIENGEGKLRYGGSIVLEDVN